MDLLEVLKKPVDEMSKKEILAVIDYYNGQLDGAIRVQNVVSNYLQKITINDEMTNVYFDMYRDICNEIRDINMSGIEAIQEYTRRFLGR